MENFGIVNIIKILIIQHYNILSKRKSTHLQMHQHNQKQDCQSCAKNSNLIKKYEQLIHLYRKKQAKLSLSLSRNTNIPTSSNTLQANSVDLNCRKLVEVMETLLKKRCTPLFRAGASKPIKKFLCLNLCNRTTKFAKKTGFDQLKKLMGKTAQQRNDSTQQADSPPIPSNKKGRQNSLLVIQKFLQEAGHKQQKMNQIHQAILKQLGQFKGNIRNGQQSGLKYLQRRNIQLQIANKRLELENNILKQSLDTSMKRQLKQTQKKQENLVMFAQQITQKNQEIQQLRQLIKQYQQSHPTHANVLQGEHTTMKKQIQEYQRLNKRLNDDLDHVKKQLLEQNKKLKTIHERNQFLEKQIFQSQKTNFQLTMSIKKQHNTVSDYAEIIKKIQKKLKRLNLYQKQLQQNLTNKRYIPTHQANDTLQQIKSQIILMFLTNISDQSYKLHSQHLFDEQEKSLLLAHKDAWMNIQDKLKVGAKNLPVPEKQMFQISQIMPKQQQMISIFQQTQIHEHVVDSNCHNHRKQGSTMRMIQLQLQIKKQISKISQLKEQFLHIRIVILNLLKTLELHNPLKQSSMDILGVIFDIFQYSQQERSSIFPKKKKMFGFM